MAWQRTMVSRLMRDRSGNFGLMMALIAIPVIGGVGAALDYSYIYNVERELYAAADAAAVGAIAEKSAGVSAAGQMMSDGQIADAEADAKKLFYAELTPNTKKLNVDFKVNITKAAQKLSTNLTFRAKVPTTFMSVLGFQSVDVSGTVTAANQLGSYMDFYMLLDNTPSMGVAASTADIATMEKNTSDKCAFACHETQNANNYYNLAKKLGVKMRIDVVRQATQSLTDTAAATRKFTDQYRMAVYTFGAKAETAGLFKVSDLDGNMTTVKTNTDSVDLMTIPYQGYNNDQQTSFDSALSLITKDIGTPGTGDSPSSRQKIIFFVADGVGDSYKPSSCTKKVTGGRCQEPIDTSFCAPIKAKGIKIAVLYTTYLPLPSNGWYNSWIKPFQGEIATRMKDCASPDLFFEVGINQGISDAMNKLFLKVINTPRVTS